MKDDVLRLGRALPTLLRVGIASIVAYRAEMVIWILSATLPLVMMAIWTAATEQAPLGLFGPTEVGRYFTTTLVVRQLTGTWVVWELNFMIRTGSLSASLLRPMNPLVFNLAETIAAIPWRLLVLTPIATVLLLWKPEMMVNPGLDRILAFFLSVVLAFLVSWLVQVLFGLAAFWIDQSQGVFSVYFAVWAFLSGYVVPRAFLPPGIDEVARWLPFYATLGAPVDLLNGDPSRSVAGVLSVQAGWVVVLLVAAAWVWRIGVRRYGAVGA